MAQVITGASEETTPVPVWSGTGSPPREYPARRVFLSPDKRSVFIFFPGEKGTGSSVRQFPLHNRFSTAVTARITQLSGTIKYSYQLTNESRSMDSVTTFGIVIYRDPKMRASAVLWSGGAGIESVPIQQVALPGAPPGGLGLWFCPEKQPLLPNSSTKFTLESVALPGFTTASSEHFPHLPIREDWPDQIKQELDPVLNPNSVCQHVITLGPRYSPNEPANHIAADYISGMRQLIQIGRLQADAKFVEEVLQKLGGIANGSATAPLVLESRTATPLEAEIANGLQFSIGMKAAAP